MGASLTVVWDDALTAYDFGPQHPLAPLRVDLTFRLARAMGVLDQPGVRVVPPADADDAYLRLVHDQAYIDVVRRLSSGELTQDLRRGLGGMDNPVFLGMHEASARVAGASLAAARAVHEGVTEHAVNIAGGLHHAMRDRASGFCVYNDPALAIAWLRAQGVDKIAYVDVDVHHGDGVEAAFWDDPQVLTISLHETGRTLFPQTGFPTTSAEAAPKAARSTSLSRRGPATTPGCARSTPSSRRSSKRGSRRSSSASTAATATSLTRWPISRCRSTASGWRTKPYTSLPIATPAGGGSPPAVVATRSWTSCHASGPTCSRSPPSIRTAADAGSQEWREHVEQVTGRPGRSG